jgi:hypothetical protein
VAFAITCRGAGIDREHRHASRLQRDHDQVLVGLDSDRHRCRILAVLSEQRHQLAEPTDTSIDLAASENLPVAVHHSDIVLCLGPIDAARDRHSPPE